MTTPALSLDRMALDEVGYESCDLAQEIRRQINKPSGYVDIYAIARALDIVEIKAAPLTSFEGALLTDAERSWGSILVNASSGKLRGRFTIAHELLHFLNDTHVQIAGGFKCRSKDIGHPSASPTPGMSRHLRQEAEANRFAVELLAPRAQFSSYRFSRPNLEHVLEVAQELHFSKEATARRYRELQSARIAMIFHKDGAIRYFDKSENFPFLFMSDGAQMSLLRVSARPEGALTTLAEADPKDWFDGPPMGDVYLQTYYQRDGYGITMLTLERDRSRSGNPDR